METKFKLKATTLSLGITSLGFSIIYGAQAAEMKEVDSQSQTHFEEVTVWGAKVSSSSQQLASDDLSLKQADHLSDLLRDIPGVDVGGTHSVNQRINIRGLNESDLDIRLDGASQHANMFHHIGNLTINPDIIKSADIQVGANSVTSGGLGGSVYFETKDAKDLLRPGEQYGARIFGGYGSNAYSQGSLTVYGLLSDHLDGMVYVYGIDRDNFEDGNGVETIGSDGTIGNMLAKIGWDINDSNRLELSYDYYRDKGDYSPRPDMSGSANQGLSEQTLLPTKYTRNTYTLGYQTNNGHGFKLDSTLYYNQTEINRDESNIAVNWPSDRLTDNTATNTNTGANMKAQSDFVLLGMQNQLTYGGEYNQQKSESEYGSSYSMSEKMTTSAVYIEEKLYLVPSFSVTAGVRYDYSQRDALTGDDSFDKLGWGLGAEWAVTEHWTLFASSRSLYEAPELLETFVKYQDVTTLDDNVKPQTGINTQGGFKFHYQAGKHFVGSNFTVFKTQLDDYLVQEYQASTGGYLITNDGDAEITGFEASVNYGYDMFNSKLSYSKSDNKNKTNDTPILFNGRSSDMGDSIALNLDYLAVDIDTLFGWTSQWVLDEDNVLDGEPIKDGYDVHNIYAQWVPNYIDGLTITVGIDNLFNEEYASHASRTGYARGIDLTDYEPGRNYKISAAYQF